MLTTAQDACLQTNNEDGLPPFQGYTGAAAGPERRIQHQHQAIIPSYEFNCCGNITEWGVDLSPAGTNITFDFDFQVWRPSPTVSETGCYSLVGNFIVRSTTIPIQPVSEHVARVTPLPQEQLQFQPGDVLGFYVESGGTTSNHDNGVVLLNSANYTTELVWHASITTPNLQSGSCPYPVGPTGVLSTSTRAAPVISLSVKTYSCSFTIVSVAPTQLRPTAVSNAVSGDEVLISGAVVLGVTVPLVVLFGLINFITIAVVIILYLKVRKLQNNVTKLNIAGSESQSHVLTLSEDNYDSPCFRSPGPDAIRPRVNIAYATSERGAK